MAKDTRGLPKNEVVKKDIAAKAEASDEKIIAQSKDMTSEQIEAANAERLKGLPTSGAAVKDDSVNPDPLTPKPTIEEITPGQEARAAARNVGTARPTKTTVLDFGKLPRRPEGGATAASVNVTDKPDVAINLIDRLKSGMGLPGEEQGHLDLALKLHEADREVAARTGKVVNDVQPNDPKATHLTVFGGHHHRLAKVMNTFKISDPEIYKNAASATGQRLSTLVHGLHKIAQEHEDSKRTITHTPKEGAMWEHPETKEIIPIAANHPDMPSAFTRTKGKVARVSRDANGAVVTTRSHEGWDSVKVRGGTTVYRKYGAPKGIDLVDHMRAEMLSEHGMSVTSRKASANKTTDILEQMNSSIPRDKKQIGVQKAAQGTTPTVTSRPKAQRTKSPGAAKIYRLSPTNVETTKPLLVDKVKPGKAVGNKPNPPKARTGKVLLGTAPLDQPLGPKAKPAINTAPPKRNASSQLMLPGTGEPVYQTTEVKPAVYGTKSGPLSKEEKKRVLYGTRGEAYLGYEPQELTEDQKEKAFKEVLSKGKGVTTAAVEEAAKARLEPRRTSFAEYEKKSVKKAVKEARTVVISPAETKTELVPTDRDWKPQPVKSQQFAIDTTDMTGAQEVKALSGMRALASQQPSASREVVVRPGGKKQAKKDMRAAKAAPKPTEPEQLSLFPDHEVVPGRSNQFYMAGSVQPISEQSKVLQGSAKAKFGRQPNNKDFEAENEGTILDKLQIPKKKD
jgi:hypothetical protein